MYLNDLNRIYNEQQKLKNLSFCDTIFDLRTLLLSFGTLTSLYGAYSIYYMHTECFNYSYLPITWSIFETISIVLWLIAISLIDWSTYITNEEMINKALAVKFRKDSKAARSNKGR